MIGVCGQVQDVQDVSRRWGDLPKDRSPLAEGAGGQDGGEGAPLKQKAQCDLREQPEGECPLRPAGSGIRLYGTIVGFL